jgi:hypothetical protein
MYRCPATKKGRTMIREIQFQGRPLYFLADDLGQVWLGGWRSREVAQLRLEQAEACDWDADQIDCSVDLQMLGSSGELLV